jgi:hypothetical protein
VVRRCPAGWTSLGVGYALTSGPLRIDGAAALGRSASWWVRNTAGRSLKAQLQLTCARLS